MQLSTLVKLPEPPCEIDPGTPILALGSCFAERVGGKLRDALFPLTLNPTGIHYNPLSLSRCLLPYQDRPELFLHQGLWRSLQHHSKVSGTHPKGALETLREAEEQRIRSLVEAEVLLLTLGTAQVWETVNTATVVSNCHRLNPELFRRRRLSVEETVRSLKTPLCRWLDEKPTRMVILTVSPVRYLRDGLVENCRGKSVLLLSCDELERSHARVVYFPSYEIFLDELRDYRFYDEGLVQPNATGIGMVWEAFCRTFLSEKSRSMLPIVERIQKLAAHRLTPRSKPAELGRKGLRLLEELSLSSPASDRLRSQFREWLSEG